MTVRVGIIGCGTVARLHAGAIERAEGIHLAACCDVDRARAERLAAPAEAFATDDLEVLLARDDVDAVVVSVPNHLHRDVAVRALAAGRSVLLEKPMALDVAQCDEIIAAADAARGVLQLGFLCRGSATAEAAKALVDAGAIGRVRHVKLALYRRRGIPGMGRWFTSRRESGGGVLIDIGVHLLDLGMHLVGRRDATRISGTVMQRFGPDPASYVFDEMWAGPPDPAGTFDVEDGACGLVRFGDDLTIEINATWAIDLPEGTLRDGVALLGERGGMWFDIWGDHVLLSGERDGHLVDSRVRVQGADPWGRCWRRQAERFAAAVRGDMPPHATGAEGRAVQRVLDAFYRSADARLEVEV